MYRRIKAAIGAGVIAVGLAVAAAGSADAGTTSGGLTQVTGSGPQVAPDHPWTIRYHDANGAISRVWHGTRAAADKLATQWQAGHLVAQVATPDIVQRSCHLPTTYWVFRHWELTCYAYSGSKAIYITGVYEVDSGNNVGYYRIGGTNHQLPRYTSDFYATPQIVVFLHIN